MKCLYILLFFLFTCAYSKDLICIIGGAQEPHWKVKRLAQQLSTESFEAIAVRFHSRRGIEQSVKKLRKQLSHINTASYDEIHFYAFTLGGVVLKETLPLLHFSPKRIVFVESPIENSISSVAQKTMPRWIMRIGVGNAVMELPTYKNSELPSNVESGLFITLGANTLAKRIQKRALKRYPESKLYCEPLAPDNFGKRAHDFFYSKVDHTELYEKPEQYKETLLNFFENGSFGDEVDRSMCNESFSFFPDIL